VLKFVATVRRWWADGRRRPGPESPYAVACSCGWVARGRRLPTHQIIPCGGCGRKIFVLPSSPLPRVAPLSKAQAPDRSPSLPRGWRRLGLIAAGLSLAAAVTLSSVLLLRRDRHDARGPGPEEIGRRIMAGQEALGRGKFQTAIEELDAAQELRHRNPHALTPTQRRRLDQLHRQAALMADLLSESLEDILRQASELEGLGEHEWHAAFSERYHGKSVIFDAEVAWDAAVGYRLGWDMFVRGARVRIELTDLRLLRALPLERPRRLLFGARLASAGLEAGGAWVVRFQPDSGVLITDAGVATACRLGQAPDPPLLDVLLRQQRWAAELP